LPLRRSGHGAALLAVLAAVLLAPSAIAQAPPAGSPSMADAARAAAAEPRLHSLLVSWRGELILEHYAKGWGASRLANIKSASKSIISALVGIAIERGFIKSVDEPIARFFPELRRDPDPRKRTITVEHLLTMQAGLESTSGEHYGPWVRSRNWVRYALDRPIVSEPGTGMEYSTGTSHLLSALLTKATGVSTRQFAQTALAQPLGITLAQWPRDPQGIYFGGNEMLLTPRQMVRFGELYLHRGRRTGKQIVPASWVDRSCEPRTVSRWNPDQRYGYGWWIRDFGGRTACFAWGYGGQYILVFRDLDLVVVTTSTTTDSEERRGYRRGLFGLIERDVLGPVSAAAVQEPLRVSPASSWEGSGFRF
jgi:CubicO group peptidase (beta-lactamase class C family)